MTYKPAMQRHALAKVSAASAAEVKPVRPVSTAGIASGHRFAATQTRVVHGGLPARLKRGIEHLSGMSMDDVKVHYNSLKPSTVGAHGYAQGNHIHLAPGQERHLPHEAWHVVQQRRRIVRPTITDGAVAINDEAHLEREADAMGVRGLSVGGSTTPVRVDPQNQVPGPAGSGLPGYATWHADGVVQRNPSNKKKKFVVSKKRKPSADADGESSKETTAAADAPARQPKKRSKAAPEDSEQESDEESSHDGLKHERKLARDSRAAARELRRKAPASGFDEADEEEEVASAAPAHSSRTTRKPPSPTKKRRVSPEPNDGNSDSDGGSSHDMKTAQEASYRRSQTARATAPFRASRKPAAAAVVVPARSASSDEEMEDMPPRNASHQRSNTRPAAPFPPSRKPAAAAAAVAPIRASRKPAAAAAVANSGEESSDVDVESAAERVKRAASRAKKRRERGRFETGEYLTPSNGTVRVTGLYGSQRATQSNKANWEDLTYGPLPAYSKIGNAMQPADFHLIHDPKAKLSKNAGKERELATALAATITNVSEDDKAPGIAKVIRAFSRRYAKRGGTNPLARSINPAVTSAQNARDFLANPSAKMTPEQASAINGYMSSSSDEEDGHWAVRQRLLRKKPGRAK